MPKIFFPRRVTGPLRGLSIQYRIPLSVSLLLFVVMSLFILISYFSIRKIEATSGEARIDALSSRLSTMLFTSIDNSVNATRELSKSPEVLNYFTRQDDVTAAAVLPVLDRYAGSGYHEKIYLYDNQLKPLLHSGESLLKLLSGPVSMPVIKDENHQACNITQIRDSIYYSTIAPVEVGNKRIGFIVRLRQVKNSEQVFHQFAGVAGKSITMLVGNDDGSLWTDLEKAVKYKLPEKLRQEEKVHRYRIDGEPVVGTARRIKNTPWLLVVEAPYAITHENSNRYLRWMVLVAGILILLSSGVAWYMGYQLNKPLKKLIASSQAMTLGKIASTIPVERTDEVGTLTQTFNTMTEQLKLARQSTQNQIEASSALNKELRRLSAYMSTVREEERVSIARELHDQLGQTLTGFKMDLHFLKKHMNAGDTIGAEKKMAELVQSVDEGVQFIRKLSSELRGGPLEDLGLIAAIQWHANNFSERYKIEVNVEVGSGELNIPLKLSTAIFRITQEALTNVARHANASRVDIKITKQDNNLSVCITDNGKGFDITKAKSKKTLGILGMNERALMISSELKISSQPGKGCKLELLVDLFSMNEYLT